MTGLGKTVALKVALSIWGNSEENHLMQTLNGTLNSIQTKASVLRNIPFGGDELQTIKQFHNGNYDSIIMNLTEGIERSRLKKTSELRLQKSWNNIFLFTGEEPITKNNSGGGSKNRVLELELSEKIENIGDLLETIKNNYGHSGQDIINIINTHRSELKTIFNGFYAELMELDTSGKQANNMACILTGDYLASKYIFEDEPLKVKDIKNYLKSEDEINPHERMYREILSIINIYQNHFIKNGFTIMGEVWGEIKEGEENIVRMNKNLLCKKLEEKGFSFESGKKYLGEKGYILKNSQGRYSFNTTINNSKVDIVKIVLPDPEENDDDLPKINLEEDLPF